MKEHDRGAASPATAPDPRKALSARGLRPKKSFGQNFLLSDAHVRAIAERCVPSTVTTADAAPLVVELGAGTGVLTAALLSRGAQVIAVERDRDLLPVLAETFAEAIAAGQLHLLEADAKQIELPQLLREHGRERCVLAGNLPYQITGALVELATLERDRTERVIFMVQREVADRITAEPRSKDYSALTVFVAAQFAARKVLNVPRTAFFPAPEVDSAVIELTPLEAAWTAETETFRAVVRGAFGQRRKKLRNAWSKLADAELLATLAGSLGISLDARGEELSVAEFAGLARALDAAGHGREAR